MKLKLLALGMLCISIVIIFIFLFYSITAHKYLSVVVAIAGLIIEFYLLIDTIKETK